MARVKNIYTSDLAIDNNKSATFKFQYDGSSTTVTVERANDLYKVYRVSSFDQRLTEMLERRYSEDWFDAKAFDQRLRDMQYEIRKSFKEILQAEGVEGVITHRGGGDAPEAPAQPEIAEIIIDDVIEEKPAPKPKVRETPKVGLEAQIFNLVWEAVESEEAADNIKKTVKRQLDEWGIVPGRVDLHVQVGDAPAINVGTQHKEFETVLMAIKAKCNVALVGPAGSGKTTVVAESAKLLGLPFYAKSVSAQTGVHELFGYQDANGNYVRTLFREAYENGGVFLLDEFDAGNPNVLASMNAATSNGMCAFPDGMITKHDDCIIVMAGNTYGHGATSEYVGRNKIDAATLDRFVYVYFDYDQEFEYQLAPNKEWCKEVQAIRERVRAKKIKAIVSPRATFEGAKLLAVGMSIKKVRQMVIYKGLTADEVAMLEN